ncbi:hypothetical protein MHU86_6000 [Fragilaria crotonensis]|nr:hypothetical protein MHU86_6000 [Fragilaria crotonensis]
MSNTEYQVGQLVHVEPRTWAGINRPGGVARIVKIDHCQYGYIETVDVKYILGSGSDTKVDLDFIQPHAELERTSRSRRGRDLYRASPAKATMTPGPSDHSNQMTTATKKRRKVSPSPGRHVLASSNTPADDLPTPTKASTVRMTLGSEQPATAKPSSIKPPVAYIIISPNPPNISPLPNPISSATHSFAVKKRDSHECKTQKPLQARTENKAVTNNSTSMLSAKPHKRKPQNSNNPSCFQTLNAKDENHPPQARAIHRPSTSKPSQVLVRTRPASAVMKQKLASIKSPVGHFKLPLASSRRVPLRQVFDQDMNVRQTFVSDIVGETKSAPKVTPVVVVDESRQRSFNERLTQLLQANGESVTRQALIAKVPEFTPVELDHCLDVLSSQSYIMVGERDGVIYKI